MDYIYINIVNNTNSRIYIIIIARFYNLIATCTLFINLIGKLDIIYFEVRCPLYTIYLILNINSIIIPSMLYRLSSVLFIMTKGLLINCVI